MVRNSRYRVHVNGVVMVLFSSNVAPIHTITIANAIHTYFHCLLTSVIFLLFHCLLTIVCTACNNDCKQYILSGVSDYLFSSNQVATSLIGQKH